MRPRAKTLFVILGLFLAHLVVAFAVTDKGIGYDGEQYLRYAEHLLASGRFTYDGVTPSCGRTPGYPAFLAVCLSVFRTLDVVYFLQLISLFGAYVLMMRTGERFLPHSWQWGMLAFFVALWPLNRLALAIHSEPVFILLTALGLYFLQRHLRRPDRTSLILFGAVMSLSAYVRPITQLFVGFVMLTLLVGRRIRLRDALVAVTVAAAVLAPWTYRNWHVFGQFVPLASTYGSIYYMSDPEEFKVALLKGAGATHDCPAYQRIVGSDFELELAANDRFLAEAVTNISGDPFGFLARCLLKTVFVWSYLPGSKSLLETRVVVFASGMAVQLLFLLTATAGALALRRRGLLEIVPAVLFALYHLLVLFPFYAESRYLVPAYIALVPLSFYTIRQLAIRVHDRFTFPKQRRPVQPVRRNALG